MEFHISRDDENVRLDRFVRKKYRDVALTAIFRLIRKGVVRVNGRKKKPDYRLALDDIVNVRIQDKPTKDKELIILSAKQKKFLSSVIVHEDDNILLCNKPPSIAMHAGSGHEYGFVEMVRAYTRNPGFTFVNRLDKATAGLVIGAKSSRAARELSALIRDNGVVKYYMTVVQGQVKEDEFTLRSFLKKEATRVQEYTASKDGAKQAITHFKVVARNRQQNTTLLEARLETGRTHQLRVQLAAAGHPIVGDGKYGGEKAPGMLLFSCRVSIISLGLDVQLPLPDYFPEGAGS
jgi:23S rRNA pseudouridine955/2504/2580 synthase